MCGAAANVRSATNLAKAKRVQQLLGVDGALRAKVSRFASAVSKLAARGEAAGRIGPLQLAEVEPAIDPFARSGEGFDFVGVRAGCARLAAWLRPAIVDMSARSPANFTCSAGGPPAKLKRPEFRHDPLEKLQPLSPSPPRTSSGRLVIARPDQLPRRGNRGCRRRCLPPGGCRSGRAGNRRARGIASAALSAAFGSPTEVGECDVGVANIERVQERLTMENAPRS